MDRPFSKLHEYFTSQLSSHRRVLPVAGPDLMNRGILAGLPGLCVGLAGGIGHMVPKMKEIFGDKIRFCRYGQRRSLLLQLGAAAVDLTLSVIKERAVFARFGL